MFRSLNRGSLARRIAYATPAGVLAATALFLIACNPNPPAWTVEDPDVGDLIDDDAPIPCIGNGPCGETAVVKLQKKVGSAYGLVDGETVSGSLNDDWQHTFHTGASGKWDHGTYRVEIEGIGNSDHSGDFTIDEV